MQVGTVQLVNADRGFGFVRPDGASGDVFFHFRALKGGLVCNETPRGRRVEFVAEDSDKGPRAKSVYPLGALAAKRR